MCGIFAYVGERNDAPTLVIEGLKKLEYRGYDSWGIAYKENKDIYIHKEVGKIGEFDTKDLDLKNTKESHTAVGEAEQNLFMAISHTRWATHGGIHKKNAHPHTNEEKDVVIVHNGVLENFDEIKKKLKKRGHKFESETDTETIAHLIEENLENHGLKKAVELATEEMVGRYAIVVMCEKENTIVAARRGSPLIIGKGKNEY